MRCILGSIVEMNHNHRIHHIEEVRTRIKVSRQVNNFTEEVDLHHGTVFTFWNYKRSCSYIVM